MSTAAKPPHLILGVDGGGSKTRAVLASLDDRGALQVLGKGLSGPSNMRLSGKKQSLNNLEQAIKAVVGSPGPAGGLPDRKIDYVVLALAGAEFPDVHAEIEDWAQEQKLFSRFEIIHDSEPVLWAGTPGQWGVALIVGTGSVAMGVSANGQTITRGGWGHWIGDRGSGYDLGRRALAAVSEADDGIGPKTALHERVLDRLKVTKPRSIMQALSKNGNLRQQMAALAPVVIETADRGDVVACRIVSEGAADVARLVISVAGSLAFVNGYPLALAGGVVCGSSSYREKLLVRIQAESPIPGPITQVDEPVDGCVEIGRARLRGAE